MAITINAKGTSASTFTIGKKGTTLHQGQAVDPATVPEGAFWFDSLLGALRYKGTDPGSWRNLVFDDISFLNNSIISVSGEASISLNGDVVLNPGSLGDVKVGDDRVLTVLDNGALDAASLGGSLAAEYVMKTDTGQQILAGDIVISGDLTVSGNTDIVQRDISTGENAILLNADWPTSTAPSENAGLFVYRGNTGEDTTGIVWDEANNVWTVRTLSGVDPSNPDFPNTGGGTVTNSFDLYHEGNKPTPADIGAATSVHNHTLKDSVSIAGSSKPWQAKEEADDSIHIGYYDSDEGSWKADLRWGESFLLYKGQYVYHEGYKPTPADIGAANESHTHSYLPLSGGTLSGELNLASGGGKGITWENGQHVMTNNDGGGNFNFRLSNVYSTTHVATVANCTPFHQVWSNDSNGIGTHSFNIGSGQDYMVNDPISWYTQIVYNKNYVRLSYSGSKKFETTNAGVTITGEISATEFNTTSSVRYKENVQDLDYTVEFDKLRPVSYNRKDNGKAEIGFIAEEVNEIIPEVVQKVDDVVEGIDYSRLTAVLTAKVQQQDAKINELEEKLDEIMRLLQK